MNNQEFFNQLTETSFDNLPAAPDANLTRYGLPLGFDVPLSNQTAADFFGDYNEKREEADGQRHNVENRMFFPRLMLMPFSTISRSVPPEPYSEKVEGNYEELQMPFDRNQAATAVKNTFREIKKTALDCALTVASKYRQHGFCLLDALTGMPPKQAFDLVAIVLPAFDTEFFPEKEKIVLGYRLKSPFLTDILIFLQEKSPYRIDELCRTIEGRAACESIRLALIVAAETAIKTGHTILDETEAEMASERPVKNGYDRPSYNVYGATDPPDLFYLAHLNRVPVSERQVAAAAVMSQAIVAGMNSQQQPQSPQPAFTPELLTAIKTAMKEEIKAELAAEQKTATAISDEAKAKLLAANEAKTIAKK